MKLFLSLLLLCTMSNSILGQDVVEKDTNIENGQMISTAIVGIDGMACQEGCADKIGLNLQNAPGVIAAEVSYEKKEALVKFDPEVVSISELESVITSTKVKTYVYTINSITIKE